MSGFRIVKTVKKRSFFREITDLIFRILIDESYTNVYNLDGKLFTNAQMKGETG